MLYHFSATNLLRVCLSAPSSRRTQTDSKPQGWYNFPLASHFLQLVIMAIYRKYHANRHKVSVEDVHLSLV